MAAVIAAAGLALALIAEPVPGQEPAPAVQLAPTAHPPVPADLDNFWYVPSRSRAPTPAISNFVKGVRLIDDGGNPAEALPLVSQKALASTALADYARYYTARALALLERHEEAEAAFAALAARPIEGHLPEDAALGHAASREARKDFAGAVQVYETLLGRKLAATHTVLFRLAVAAEQAGSQPRALDAYRRVYYEYPLSSEAAEAGTALSRLDAWGDLRARLTQELARGDALFAARRWTDARESYERARPYVSGEETERVGLRMAACDARLGRHRQVIDPLRALVSGAHSDEAHFYYLVALRGVGDNAEYERATRIFAEEHTSSPFAEEALNNLASHFIIADEDARADEVFRLIIERYPAGRFTERAYWRSGWWAYRDDRFAEAASLFDRGAARFPRSDYRPSWLFWSGRAWARVGNQARAAERLRLTATDYFNSYYGRLALTHLGAQNRKAVTPNLSRQPAEAPQSFPTLDQVALLIASGLNQEALNELQYAQRLGGSSPALTATIALVQNRLGNLRLGINAMKRAYPQWMAAGGETLPIEIQKVVFPLDYWPLLQKQAASNRLDPYLVAALVAQESTFDPAIRSSANAVGLMQVLPSTGREWARKLGIPRFAAARLTEPELNVRLGTAIFADNVRRFGGVHYALAAYNAGNHRVSAWQRERQGMPQDEFIDDIPFPETQNYVKRILGTADDYRRLYGKPAPASTDMADAPGTAPE
jgi:soluble lytic murein transglycosylase